MAVYEINHNNNIVKSCRILALHEVSRECVWSRSIYNSTCETNLWSIIEKNGIKNHIWR